MTKPAHGKMHRLKQMVHPAMVGRPAGRYAAHVIPEGEIVIPLDTQEIYERTKWGDRYDIRYCYRIEFLARTNVFTVRIDGEENVWTKYFERVEGNEQRKN